MATVKGAGDTQTGSNPGVSSKFDKSQGKGLKAPHQSFPGQTAGITGSTKAGFNENGRMNPKSTPYNGLDRQTGKPKVIPTSGTYLAKK